MGLQEAKAMCEISVSVLEKPSIEPVPAMISFKQFAGRATEKPHGSKQRFDPDQFVAALGGIADLYRVQLAKSVSREIKVATSHAFASQQVPLDAILEVIHSSTGASRGDSEVILKVLEATLRDYFQQDGYHMMEVGSLGVLQPIDVKHSRYLLECKAHRHD